MRVRTVALVQPMTATVLRPTADVTPRPPNGRRAVVRVFGALVSPRTWGATMHVLLDFVVGLPMFVFVVVGLSLIAGLAVTVVFAVISLAVLLVGLRLFGKFERARFASLLGVPISDPYPVFHGSLWTQLRLWLFGAAPWKELAYALVLFPLSCIGVTLVTFAWSGSLALFLLPLYVYVLPDQAAHFFVVDIGPGPGIWIVAAVGAAGLLVAPWVARGWAALDVVIGTALLERHGTEEIEQLEERVETLETSRSWALEIAEAERRRIERDLHDGAQQRLVAVAMDLGLAREKLDTDPDRARELIEHAHDESKIAIAELRDLARGIHPVALGDRGLPGAIPALAGRCAIPVDVQVSVPNRPSASIEGIAYFIVSECLANAVKHSSATWVNVSLRERGDRLCIEVTDNGVGGADMTLGSGLLGLADRASSVDGTFDLSSPLGGPTVISVELPCES